VARTTIRTGDITDSSVTAAKLATTAITDKLGYTPLQASDLNNYVTLTGSATLTNKTTQNLILTGTLTAGSTTGSSGQYLQSTGSGVQWVSLSIPSPNSFTNIAVTGQNTVVADSSSDTLTFIAGTGITITTDNTSDSITITGSAVNNVFSTIAVSGQSNVIADATSDTLTFVAGSNITITTDSTNDSITINATDNVSNSFATIAVAGHSNVVADSSTDILTLLASSGIDISTNATTDTITITNTGVTSVNGLTGSVSAQNIIDAVKSLDGPNSGLDADTLDGNDGSYYQQALGYTPVNKAGDTMTGNLTLSGAPTNSLHAATKQYVDDVASGLHWKGAVNLLAASNIALTGNTNTLVIDGHDALVSADSGYRILLKNQTTAANNGIYTYTDNGTTYTLTRSIDADTFQELEGTSVLVLEGTTYALTGWVQTNYSLTSFSGQTWVQFNSGGGVGGSDTFRTIAVNGQNSVVADSSTDTLTLVAGTGIVITTDAATDSITINSTGGGGGGSGGITTTVDKFTGNGSTTQYTLSSTPTNEDHTIVVIEGVVQFKDTYSVSGNVLTFSSAPYNGYNLEITTISGVLVNAFSTIAVAGQSNVVADSSSDTLTLSAGSGIAITTTAGTDTVAVAVDNTVATLTGTQTLTNKTLTSPVLGGITTSASGNIVVKPATSILEVQGSVAASSGVSQTYTVTVVGGVYVIDGVTTPILSFVRTGVYTFNQSAASNTGHPIAFKDGSGASYTTGVVTTGTPGSSGAQTVITVASDAPNDLRYYCVVHGNSMGNTIGVTGTAGTEYIGQIQLNCPVNTHGQKISAQPHAAAATNKLTLPGGTVIGNADAVLVSDTGTQTLTNKTISLSNNTVSGTLAQFNTAVTDADLATIAGSETLTNKTLTSPVLNTATADNLTLTGTLTANAAVGSAGQVLKSTGTGVQWANESGGSSFSTITVAGQSNVVADSASDTLTLIAGDNVTITTNANDDSITISATGGGGGGGNSFTTIAVSGQTSVVADSSTDTLTLAAGSGISISTDATTDTITITNTGGGGGGLASDSFKTISVAGQSNVVADSATDTLTLTAGPGVSITTDGTTDTITISATGGGGGGGGSDIPVIANSFTGNGSQTVFTLSATPGNKDQTLVIVGGVPQAKATYSLTGTTLTFSEAPENGYEIEIIIFAQSTTPGDGTSIGKAIALSMFFG